jgi:hypothetical protein
MEFTVSSRLLLWLAVSLFTVTSVQAEELCASFAPDEVTIRGTLERHVFPGPPEYDDLTAGDEPEVGFYLALAEPLCVTGNDDDEGVGVEDDLRLIQLVLDQEDYDKLRPYLSETVTLKGTLFSALTGHHHSQVLLQQVQLLEGKPTELMNCEVLDENVRLDNGGYRPLLQGTITGTRRAYFHDAPHASCSAQKSYLVAGDRVKVWMGADSGWVYATYTAKNGKEYAGWLDQAQVVLNACPGCELPEETLDPEVEQYLDLTEACTPPSTGEGCGDLEQVWHSLRKKYRNNQPVLNLLGESWPQL